MANPNQDWEDLGRNIQDIIDQAINSQDYRKLNQTITRTVSHAMDVGGEAVRRAAYFAREMGVRTYVVHSSTREAMEALAADKHPNLYVETTSPYLCLDTDSPIGAYGKMLPPKAGIALIAKATHADILPAWVSSSFPESFRKSSSF